jgi:hypothetical protein
MNLQVGGLFSNYYEYKKQKSMMVQLLAEELKKVDDPSLSRLNAHYNKIF